MRAVIALAFMLSTLLWFGDVQADSYSFSCRLPMGQTTVTDCGDGPFTAQPGDVVKIRVVSNTAWFGAATFTLIDFDEKRGLASVTPLKGGDAAFIWTNDSALPKRVWLSMHVTHIFETTVTGEIRGVKR